MITMPATENMPSRVAASICYATGCPEMVALSYFDYEEKAVALALEPAVLQALRAKVQHNRLSCPLFDTFKWVKNLEKGLLLAWQIYLTQGTYCHIEIEDSN